MNGGVVAPLVLKDIVVHRSSGGHAALVADPGEQVECTCCDFGTGPDDNVPADAEINGVTQSLPQTFSI